MRITIVLLLLLNAAFAQNPFLEWINPTTELRQRFSTTNYTLSTEKANGSWSDTVLTTINPQEFVGLNYDLQTRSFVLKGGKLVYLTLNGSQRVYAFDVKTKHLSRIDRTWNNGYNYNSAQFVRKDTLYSIGGYGFWHYNHLITYFDSNRKEWETISSTGKSPETIVGGYQGYDAQLDYFYSGASERSSDRKGPLEKEFDNHFYQFDFKRKKWTYLGELNGALPFKTNRNVAWTGAYFFHFSQDKLYIMSPSQNKAWTVADGKTFFDTYHRFYPKGDTLFCYTSLKSGPTKYSIKRLLSSAKSLGPMYATPISNYINYALLALFLGFSLVLLKLIRAKKRRKVIEDISFKKQELILIDEFLKLTDGKFLTSNDINEIIGISDKGLENQRKIRTAVISQINDKIAMHYQITNAIERQNHPEDKRLKLYQLKKNAYHILNKSNLAKQ